MSETIAFRRGECTVPGGSPDGTVIVVTGASRGIGRSTAVALAASGHHVVLAATTEHALDEVGAAIRADGGRATAVPCDVGDRGAVDALFRAADQIGRIRALVCAAGVLVKGGIDEITPDQWGRSLAVNLTGTFLCCQKAFMAMKQGGAGGQIVTIASLSGIYAVEKFPGLGAYNASKSGVVGLTETLALEGKEHGIMAVCVSPGAVDTRMLREANPNLRPGLGPDDVGRLIADLLALDLRALSGANIPLFSNL